MGLYSTNRIGAFSESIGAIVKEIEETPYDPNFGSLMEYSIMLNESEQMMFDALIEADFISATNEAVMLEEEAAEANKAGDEVKKKKIGERIKEIIDKVITAIKKAVSNFIAKVVSIIKNDKKLIDSYKDKLNERNLTGFKGIPDFAFPKEINEKDVITASGAQFKGIWDNFYNASARASSRDEIETAAETALKSVGSDSGSNDNKKNDFDNQFFEKKVKSFVPNTSQIELMKKKLTNANEVLKEVKNIAAKTISELKQIKASVGKFRAKGNLQVDMQAYGSNKAYTVISAICKSATKTLSAITNAVSRQIAAYRKCWILCGRYANKGKAQKSDDYDSNLPAVRGGDIVDSLKNAGDAAAANESYEEEIMSALAEASDVYVYEHLGYGIY